MRSTGESCKGQGKLCRRWVQPEGYWVSGNLYKASHQCYVCMIRKTPTPGHPSTADDAWYWQKRILRTKWLLCLTSRPMSYMGVHSKGSCDLLMKIMYMYMYIYIEQIYFCYRGYGNAVMQTQREIAVTRRRGTMIKWPDSDKTSVWTTLRSTYPLLLSFEICQCYTHLKWFKWSFLLA